jgi:hypothetical protein
MRALRRRQQGDETVSRHRLGLAPECERRDRFRLERSAHEPQGGLADQDLARLCRLLERGGGVHRVARREALLGAGDDLAVGEADAGLHAKLGQRVPHLDRGAAST